MGDNNAQAQEWVIKVRETGREYRFHPGDSVVIGRTPLRPSSVADPGDRRLDISDPQKSMSKRHARFTVNRLGEARIRDLHSTNGTYVVRSDGELMRLPLDEEYTVHEAPLRLQFGDVAVELLRGAAQGTTSAVRAQRPSEDLFSHAPQAVFEGVDAPSLSVDEILDVRAGEPTEMFNAQKVRQQVLGGGGESLAVGQKPGEGSASAPESDFAKMKQDLEKQSEMQRQFLEQREESRVPQEAGDVRSSENAPSAEAAQSYSTAQSSTSAQSSTTAQTYGTAQPVETAQPEETASAATSLYATNEARPYVPPSEAEGPVFEPGSVLDRLTKGELNQHTPAVEIDGLNSDDAQRTDDQSLQFEMAKHHELLAFLALNPHLYDDLYAWLEAIGDPDITAALSTNAGYATYREGRK